MKFIMLALLAAAASAQEPKPLDNSTAKTHYSFAVRPGREPIEARVDIGAGGVIAGVLLFRPGSGEVYQRFNSCLTEPEMQLVDGDENLNLVEHADFNFDGYEDLMLLQFHHPHLGRRSYCVYLWNERLQKFRYEPQIPMPEPIPDPKNQTITTQLDYMGGISSTSVYVWAGKKIIEIARWGMSSNVGGQDYPACVFVIYCEKRINGRIRRVAEKTTGCNGEPPDEVMKCTPPSRSVWAAAQRLKK